MQMTSLKARIAAGALTATTLIGAAFPAAGQQVAAPFSSEQCRIAQAVIYELLGKYKGRISPELARSFVAFSRSNCDMNTDLARRPGMDDDVFGEFNLRMVAIRRQQVSSASPR